MKALVLCGGIPQIALIKELKKRGIYTILADMNEKVVAKKYADEFYPVSVFDVEVVIKLAKEKKVDFVITVCADQVLLVQSYVSEILGLPCYIDYKTAKNVSNKELMKKVFVENNIPTSKFVVMDKFNLDKIKDINYPLIVKPVDSYSSRGVRKVYNKNQLEDAFDFAINISRNKKVIVEEYVDGEEITVDIYVEDGNVHILNISNVDKIPNGDKFVICRTRYPAIISDDIKNDVYMAANKIVKAFMLKNSPMLIQMVVNKNGVFVIEFCARTGGGDKFIHIKDVSNFDVVKAVVDLTLGQKPHVVEDYQSKEFIVNEFLYSSPCEFDHLEGFDKMQKIGLIDKYYLLKSKGTICGEIMSSGDRVAYYTVKGTTFEEVKEKDKIINENIKIIDSKGKDKLKHKYVANY